MHPKLSPLPDVFLQHLGRFSRLDYLVAAFKQRQYAPSLCVPHDGQPYTISTPYGVDLKLQCANPLDAPAEQLWGLCSLSFHTALSNPLNHWKDPWPEGIHPGSVTAQEMADQLASEDEEVLLTPTMACFVVPGVGDQQWTLLGHFHQHSKKLLTLSLLQAGHWVAASVLPPAPAAN